MQHTTRSKRQPAKESPSPQHIQNSKRSHKSEQPFSTIFETIQDPIYIKDASLRYSQVNPAMERLFGLSVSSFNGHTDAEIFGTELNVPVQQTDLRVLAGETIQEEFTQVINGVLITLRVTKVPLLNSSGKVTGLCGIARDITEYKRATQENRELKELNESIIQNMGEGIAVEDDRGNFTFVNPAAGLLLNYPPQMLIGQPWTTIVPLDQQAIVQTANRRRQSGESDRYEIELLRQDGTRCPVLVSASPRFDEHKNYAGSIAVFTDITQRKHSEEALRENAERSRRAAKATGQMIYDCNLSTGKINWAGAVTAVTGYSFQDFQDRDAQAWALLVHPDDRESILQQIDAARSQLREFHVEYRFQRKDGTYANIEDWGTILPNQAGQPVQMIGAMKDITERKQAEQQLVRHAGEFAALYETARDLSTQNDIPGLVRTLIERACELLKTTTGAIFLYDATRGDLELAVAKDFQIAAATRMKLGEGMAGRVALSRQSLCVDNYSTWEHRLPEYAGVPFAAILQVPMIFGGELIGVLDVSEVGPSTRKFTKADERFLSLLAAQAAGAVYNARLIQQTRQRAEQLALLYDAGLTLNRTIEPQAIIGHLLEIARKTVHADRSDFFRYDANLQTLTFENGSGYGSDVDLAALRVLKFAVGEEQGLAGLVAADRTPLYIPDTRTDARWISMDPSLRSAIWLAVEREQQLFGVLSVASTRVAAFSPADQRLVALFANQVAVALERAHLFEAERNRRTELGALYQLSRALTDTDSLDTILDLVVEQTVQALNITFARLALLDGETLVTRAAYPIRQLDCDLQIGRRDPLSQLALCQRIQEENIPIVLNEDDQVSDIERQALLLNSVTTLCLVPLRAGEQVLGFLMLGEMRCIDRAPFTPEKVHLARNIGDQAASAIQRAKFHRQTENRLRQVQALHTIDMTITASLDLSVTMNVLLSHVTSQLHADAADILMFNPHTQLLEYLAGLGFRSNAVEHSPLRLGQDPAGRAALDRRFLSVPNLRDDQIVLTRKFLVTDEDFVTGHTIPLVARGQIKGVLEVFYRSPFQPDPDWLDLLEALGTQAAIAIENAELFKGLQRSNLDLSLAYDATIEGWARALDLRDKETAGHTERVVELTLRLAKEMKMRSQDLIHIRHGALLHDIGKMGIPDSILFKPGELTEDEQAVMRQHPIYAYELLSPIGYLRPALDIPYCHHEHWDGSGHPRGLRLEQIPLAARIFAVVDAWDALVSGRTFDPPWETSRVREHVQSLAGKWFDPQVVEVFLKMV